MGYACQTKEDVSRGVNVHWEWMSISVAFCMVVLMIYQMRKKTRLNELHRIHRPLYEDRQHHLGPSRQQHFQEAIERHA